MSIRESDLSWEFFGPDHTATLGFHLVRTLAETAATQLPALADLFPFRQSWACETHIDSNWWMARLSDSLTSGVPRTGELADVEVVAAGRRIATEIPFPDLEMIIKGLPAPSLTARCFTYVGPREGSLASYPHVMACFEEWANSIVVPSVERWNQERVIRALPASPSYDVQRILRSAYVVESDSASRQGTCFHLLGVGLVTCDHVLEADSRVFRASEAHLSWPVVVTKRNKAVDLAILEVPAALRGDGLDQGDIEGVKQMSHVAVVGFPNFRRGDSGILSPGFVVGFRTVSAIRRFLVSSAIVAGTSGGPVLDRTGRVVGVAVTGADRLGDAPETEDHGVIPIDATALL